MEIKVTCTYCMGRFDSKTMTPLHEVGKDYVHFYCERCQPDVQYNLRSLPWYKNYIWGKKGDID